MYALDQSLPGGYRVAELRSQARRDADARTVYRAGGRRRSALARFIGR